MNTPRIRTPFLIPAALLSAGSLIWTTWSLVDLLGAGPWGFTVAAGADIFWASVIRAEARALRLRGRRWPVAAIGWAALAAVAGLLVWHGIDRGVPAMAVAGPLLPLGAKVVWLLALADMRDPSALTDDDQALLAEEERAMRFEEARHRHELRRREMAAEQLLADVSVDFEIEIARQDKGRELARRAPFVLTANTTEPVREHAPEPNRTTEPPHASGRPEHATTSTNTDREQPSITELAREHVANTPDNAVAVRSILALRPDANEQSVAATVRRVRKQLDARGGYR